MNIVMVSSEVLPISKTGGLADVVYSLSKEYVKSGHKVSIITPLYKNGNLSCFKNVKQVMSFKTIMNWREISTSVQHSLYKGIDYYFIDVKQYFDRDGFYGYYDDGERFALFSNATIEILKRLPYKVDILNVHDWQAAMIPCLLKVKYFDNKSLNKIKTVLTIHNPLFKGYLNKDSLFDLYNLGLDIYYNGKVRLEEQVSTLKAGIVYSDKITTVSPTHKEELLTYEGGKGLNYDLRLRENDFAGFLNGMDYDEFNPRKDKAIFKNYSLKTLNEGKFKNKVEICKVFNLNPKLPLFAVVSRLTDQKGVDLILAMADFISHEGGNFALIGSGERWAEDNLRELKNKNPNNVYIYFGYNEELAHKLYSAADFFIMPSAFEPCGLGQMIAQRYGTIPIIRQTGGLKDSVICLSEDNKNYKVANGIGFERYNVIDSLKASAKALIIYSSKNNIFNRLRINAFKTNHSWANSAKLYLGLYEELLKNN